MPCGFQFMRSALHMVIISSIIKLGSRIENSVKMALLVHSSIKNRHDNRVNLFALRHTNYQGAFPTNEGVKGQHLKRQTDFFTSTYFSNFWLQHIFGNAVIDCEWSLFP